MGGVGKEFSTCDRARPEPVDVPWAFRPVSTLAARPDRDGARQLHIAEKADPLSPEVHYDLSSVLGAAGRYDESARYCEKLPAGYWAKGACLAGARSRQGRNSEAIRMLETQ